MLTAKKLNKHIFLKNNSVGGFEKSLPQITASCSGSVASNITESMKAQTGYLLKLIKFHWLISLNVLMAVSLN